MNPLGGSELEWSNNIEATCKEAQVSQCLQPNGCDVQSFEASTIFNVVVT